MSAPVSEHKKPFLMDEAAGKRAWCACGLSKKQPYCDGSHKDTDLRPIIVEITEARQVLWCGCKQSGKKPYCDGTHTRL